MRNIYRAAFFLLCLSLVMPAWAQRPQRPRRGRGGMGGFKVLRDPQFVPAAEAKFLKDTDRVIGVAGNGVAKVYPAPWLAWHHIIEDQLGDMPILATW